ncbi:MAG: type II secretion system protein [bacterium]|nr:type II secretion system protein [bacterium]
MSKGFTLIEVLITIALLGIILAPLLGLFMVGLSNSNNNQNMSEASYIAQSKLEEVVAADATARLGMSTGVLSYNSIFTFQRQVVNHPSGLLQVTVTVFWTDKAVARQYRMVGLYARQ